MINPRFLIQLPLIVLGSCVPLTPSTSIIVYSSSGQPTEIRALDPYARPNPKTGIVDSIVCKVRAEKEAAAYQLPQRPDFSDIAVGDDQAVVDRLIDSNETLRAELKAAKEENLCLIRQVPNLQKTHN